MFCTNCPNYADIIFLYYFVIKIEESQIQYYYCIILNICLIELSKSANK